MKKMLLFLAVFSFFFSLGARAQCDMGIIEGMERHVHDTTFKRLTIDTTWYGSAGYSCVWTFPDGSSHSGLSIEYPFTIAQESIELTFVVTGPGCTSTQMIYPSVPVVFNCAQLFNSNWGDYFGTPRQTGPNANDVAVSVLAPSFGDSSFKINLSLDWGNGHNVFLTRSTDILWSIGGVDDTLNASHYQYAGEYTLHATYHYSYDTLTCPVRSMDFVTIHVGGLPAIPELYGSTTYCAGDTVKLYARDTTLQFHNMFHHPTVAGIMSYWPDYYDPYTFGGYETNSAIYFQWYDKNYNFLSQDTVLVAPNLRVQDSGMYILRAIDGITGRDTQAVIHIVVTGSRLTLDTFAAPTCTATGTLYLNCHRSNDSVAITYIKDGIQQTFTGRTSANGHIHVPGLTEGDYSEIQARFWGDACSSNSISGPYSFHSLPSPVTVSYLRMCAGGSLTLTASSSVSGASYLWQGPGGFTSTQQNPVITTGSTATLQQYSVSITSGICAPSYISVTNVVVSSAPPNVSAAHFNDSVCAGTNFNLSGVVYDYSYLSNSITSSDTTVVNGTMAVRQGSSALTYTVSNLCGTSSFTQTVYVRPTPVLPNITGPTTACIGSMVTYTIATTGGTWSTVGVTAPTDIITDHSFRFKVGASSAINPLTYTKDSGRCRSVARVSLTTLDSARLIYLPPVGLYPGDTITPVARMYASNYWGYGGSTTLSSPIWTPVSGPIATVNSAGLISAGTQPGSILLNVGYANTCGSGSDSSEAYVSDWIDSRVARGMVQDMVRDTAGNLYVLGDRRIRKIDRNRNESIIAGLGISENWAGDNNNAGYSGDGGHALEADLGLAKSITRDNTGNIYLSYPGEGVIRKIDTSGIITRFAGILGNTDWWPSHGYSGDGGPATAAHITASYMVTDNAGNLYFSENNNHRIRKVDAGGIITTIAGDGTVGVTGDGGAATSAKVGWPMGLAIDTSGNIIVSTVGRLRRIDPSGNITTIAGRDSGYVRGGQQATATQPIFGGSVVCDKRGNIFCVSVYSDNHSWYYPYSPYSPYYYYYYGYGYSGYTGFYNVWRNSTKRIDKDGIVSIVGANQQPYQELIDAGPSVHTSAYNAVCVDDSGGIYIAGNSQTIRHSGKPTLEILASQDTICHGPATVTFTARSHYTGSSASYQWQKNGINVGTDNIVYADPSFAAGDSISCKVYMTPGGLYLASAKRSVAIAENMPVISPIAGMNVVCVADSITLTDTASGGVWSSNNSAVTVVNGNVVGITAGSSIITYTLTNACGTATDTMMVTINPLPNAGMLMGVPEVCEGSTITLSNTATGGAWSSSTASATVASGVVTGVSAGTSIISYSSTNTCGTAMDTMEITVNPLPVPISITGPTTACVGANITLTGGALGASWTSSNGSASVAGGLVYGIYAGTTVIECSMSNSCGTASDTMLITVVAQPGAGLTSGVNVMCAGAIATLTNSGGLPGGTWSSSNDAVATVTNGVVTGVATGTSIISYSFTNYCGTATDTLEMTVNGLPAPGTISGADSICEGSSVTLIESVTGGIWSSSTSAVGTVTSAGMFTAIHEGDVEVTYSLTGICGTSVAFRTLHVIASAACDGGTGVRTSFNIYPDPNNGSFTVEIPQPGNNAEITVMDVTGRKIQTITPQAGQLLVPVELANMPSGTYLVKLIADGKVYSGKVVIR